MKTRSSNSKSRKKQNSKRAGNTSSSCGAKNAKPAKKSRQCRASRFRLSELNLAPETTLSLSSNSGLGGICTRRSSRSQTRLQQLQQSADSTLIIGEPEHRPGPQLKRGVTSQVRTEANDTMLNLSAPAVSLSRSISAPVRGRAARQHLVVAKRQKAAATTMESRFADESKASQKENQEKVEVEKPTASCCNRSVSDTQEQEHPSAAEVEHEHSRIAASQAGSFSRASMSTGVSNYENQSNSSVMASTKLSDLEGNVVQPEVTQESKADTSAVKSRAAEVAPSRLADNEERRKSCECLSVTQSAEATPATAALSDRSVAVSAHPSNSQNQLDGSVAINTKTSDATKTGIEDNVVQLEVTQEPNAGAAYQSLCFSADESSAAQADCNEAKCKSNGECLSASQAAEATPSPAIVSFSQSLMKFASTAASSQPDSFPGVSMSARASNIQNQSGRSAMTNECNRTSSVIKPDIEDSVVQWEASREPNNATYQSMCLSSNQSNRDQVSPSRLADYSKVSCTPSEHVYVSKSAEATSSKTIKNQESFRRPVSVAASGSSPVSGVFSSAHVSNIRNSLDSSVVASTKTSNALKKTEPNAVTYQSLCFSADDSSAAQASSSRLADYSRVNCKSSCGRLSVSQAAKGSASSATFDGRKSSIKPLSIVACDPDAVPGVFVPAPISNSNKLFQAQSDQSEATKKPNATAYQSLCFSADDSSAAQASFSRLADYSRVNCKSSCGRLSVSQAAKGSASSATFDGSKSSIKPLSIVACDPDAVPGVFVPAPISNSNKLFQAQSDQSEATKKPNATAYQSLCFSADDSSAAQASFSRLVDCSEAKCKSTGKCLSVPKSVKAILKSRESLIKPASIVASEPVSFSGVFVSADVATYRNQSNNSTVASTEPIDSPGKVVQSDATQQSNAGTYPSLCFSADCSNAAQASSAQVANYNELRRESSGELLSAPESARETSASAMLSSKSLAKPVFFVAASQSSGVFTSAHASSSQNQSDCSAAAGTKLTNSDSNKDQSEAIQDPNAGTYHSLSASADSSQLAEDSELSCQSSKALSVSQPAAATAASAVLKIKPCASDRSSVDGPSFTEFSQSSSMYATVDAATVNDSTIRRQYLESLHASGMYRTIAQATLSDSEIRRQLLPSVRRKSLKRSASSAGLESFVTEMEFTDNNDETRARCLPSVLRSSACSDTNDAYETISETTVSDDEVRQRLVESVHPLVAERSREAADAPTFVTEAEYTETDSEIRQQLVHSLRASRLYTTVESEKTVDDSSVRRWHIASVRPERSLPDANRSGSQVLEGTFTTECEFTDDGTATRARCLPSVRAAGFDSNEYETVAEATVAEDEARRQLVASVRPRASVAEDEARQLISGASASRISRTQTRDVPSVSPNEPSVAVFETVSETTLSDDEVRRQFIGGEAAAVERTAEAAPPSNRRRHRRASADSSYFYDPHGCLSQEAKSRRVSLAPHLLPLASFSFFCDERGREFDLSALRQVSLQTRDVDEQRLAIEAAVAKASRWSRRIRNNPPVRLRPPGSVRVFGFLQHPVRIMDRVLIGFLEPAEHQRLKRLLDDRG
ncbi:hypothetical protein BOX15_Mlig004331g1 [Macrostomum lignano]|uniref:Ig-like domain-containing protein n=1 Tax=Macrostomum lignano TaxID=282301 RepID=A0A267GDP8_9PLAT|nr:hypothetical protein BOX15_Mlig004331g1 [Macrostomum lignano]